MKTTIKYISTLFFGAALLLSSGCKKFLEEVDPSNPTSENFQTEYAEPSINAAYNRLYFLGEGAGIFSENFQMLEMLSGTSGTESGQNTDLNNLQALSYNADNVHITNWWNNCYRGIAQANLAIDKISGVTGVDDALKKRYLAQAQFLRAQYYFWLVRLFGDIPLITKPILSGSDENILAPRTPQAQVYDFIVADLVSAEAGGLSYQDATGRASLGAVKTLLSSVYLTMAGFPLNKGAQYYRLAADKANEVITNGGYTLFTDYNDLHRTATKNRGEFIFMVQYTATIINNPFQGVLLPNFKDISAYGTEIGTTVPTPAFYNSFDAADKRKAEKQFFYTSYFAGGNGASKSLGNPYIYKFFDVVANGTSGTAGTALGDINYPLMRYPEVLLIYAEAQNEADGSPNAAAYAAINSIRLRATLPALSGLNQQAFREAVWREKGYELCYEGKTWFDMIRTRKAFNEATKGFDDFVGHKFSYGPTLASKHLLLPLPTTEIRNNPNLKPQNPGY